MSKELRNIKSFRDLHVQKARLRYEVKYKEDLLKNGIIVFRTSFHRSVFLSMRNLAQDTLSLLIIKLITRQRNKKKLRK